MSAVRRSGSGSEKASYSLRSRSPIASSHGVRSNGEYSHPLGHCPTFGCGSGSARTWPTQRTAASCLVGYSSPRCPRRRSRSRPMNHPITNAANRKAMVTPMLTSHIGENDSGAVFDGHGARRRYCINAFVRTVERIASPVHASATACREEIDGLRCCLGPKTGLGHVFACLLWIRRCRGVFRGFVPAAKAPIRRARLILPS
jgi:hypothetical protein